MFPTPPSCFVPNVWDIIRNSEITIGGGHGWLLWGRYCGRGFSAKEMWNSLRTKHNTVKVESSHMVQAYSSKELLACLEGYSRSVSYSGKFTEVKNSSCMKVCSLYGWKWIPALSFLLLLLFRLDIEGCLLNLKMDHNGRTEDLGLIASEMN